MALPRTAVWTNKSNQRGGPDGGQEVRGRIVVRGRESLPHGEDVRVKPPSKGTRCGTNRVSTTNGYKTSEDSLAVGQGSAQAV